MGLLFCLEGATQMKKTAVSAVLVFVLALTAVVLGACTSSSSSSSAASGSASASAASSSAASSTSAASSSASAAAASSSASSASAAAPLADGVYTVKFDTDSTMFHVNETYEGKATLTVENGQMTVHVTLAGTGFTKLFLGNKDDAAKEGAVVYEFTPEVVKYKDGTSDEAYAFDLPVPVLGEPFDVATYGPKRDLWYDHTVTISNPEPVREG